MEKIIDFLSNPFLWGIVMLILSIALKKKKDNYLFLLREIIDVIEVFDQKIKDVIPEEYEKKLLKIKEWINKRIGKNEKRILDNELQRKGLLKKSAG